MQFSSNCLPNNFEERLQGVAYNVAFLSNNSAKVWRAVTRRHIWKAKQSVDQLSWTVTKEDAWMKVKLRIGI